MFVPKLFPSFEVNPQSWHSFFGHSFRFLAWRAVTRGTGSNTSLYRLPRLSGLTDLTDSPWPSNPSERLRVESDFESYVCTKWGKTTQRCIGQNQKVVASVDSGVLCINTGVDRGEVKLARRGLQRQTIMKPHHLVFIDDGYV
jgi:hypothetical protein